MPTKTLYEIRIEIKGHYVLFRIDRLGHTLEKEFEESILFSFFGCQIGGNIGINPHR